MPDNSEAATQRCSMKKVFWKYTANLQENNHAEVWITLRHCYSPVNLLHIFRIPFPRNTSGRLLLKNNLRTLDSLLIDDLERITVLKTPQKHCFYKSRPLFMILFPFLTPLFLFWSKWHGKKISHLSPHV